MSNKHQLFEIADRQQGYFTSTQAEQCGFSRTNFHRYLSNNEWIKEERGIYRLAHYPITNRPELVLWSLWSRNKNGLVQGVWSHETALDIYELSDVMPSKMHMTVPKKFRRRVKPPKILVLHFADLSEEDIRSQQGYRVTSPLRTLIDSVESNRLSEDLISQALHDALRKGIISREELNESNNRTALKKLLGFLNDTSI
jgi:predicted transcriptional regulator of viral defense system